MSSTKPSRHHYVPQFYLRGWAAEKDGPVWQSSRTIGGKFEEKPVPTKSTAFAWGLYSTEPDRTHLPELDPNKLENTYFRDLDNRAARALQTLLVDVEMLTVEERRDWARFVNSLFERSPHVLSERDERAEAAARAVVDDFKSRGSSPESFARTTDVLAGMNVVGVARNAVLSHAVGEIDDPAVLDYLAGMKWIVLHLGPEVELVTTDDPLVVNGGRDKSPLQTIALALTPEALLFMHPSSVTYQQEDLRDVILAHTLILLQGAYRYVYSRGPLRDGPAVRARRAAYFYLVGVPEES